MFLQNVDRFFLSSTEKQSFWEHGADPPQEKDSSEPNLVM